MSSFSLKSCLKIITPVEFLVLVSLEFIYFCGVFLHARLFTNELKFNKTFDSFSISDPKTLADYRAGFNQCANEVNRNILTSEGSDQLRGKLLNHLASCCHGNATSRVATSHAPGIPAMTPSFPTIAPSAVWVPYPSPPPSPDSKSTVFLPVSLVQPEMPRISSPMILSAAHVQKVSVSPPSSPNATTKAALWRPW